MSVSVTIPRREFLVAKFSTKQMAGDNADPSKNLYHVRDSNP